MEGNTKIKVDPTFNDIDLKESPIISPSEPPPSYYEFSGHENRIYPLTPVALSYNDPKIDKPIIKSNVDAPRCSNNNCSVNTSKTLYCHHCNAYVQSRLSYKNSKSFYRRLTLSIIISILCPFYLVCLLCFLMSNNLKEIVHTCPSCNNVLNVHCS